MLPEHIKEHLLALGSETGCPNGWEVDRWGNLKKTTEKGVYRLKFNSHSCRYEKQVKPNIDGGNRWVRLRSAYYRNVTIGADGRLTGFQR